MTIATHSGSLAELECDWLVVPVREEESWSGPVDELDAVLDGELTRLREQGDLNGKLAESITLFRVPQLAAARLVLVGVGKRADLTAERFRRALMTVLKRLAGKAEQRVTVSLLEDDATLPQETQIEVAASCLRIATQGQGVYRSETERYAFEAAAVHAVNADQDTLERHTIRGDVLGQAVNLTRELVNRCPEDIYPESFAQRARAVAADCGLQVQVFDEGQLDAERMQAMLAVARGSTRPPRMVVLEHRGAGDEAPVLALCGKGVTFDSGGLSLKTGEGMTTMKSDMAGAATVLGAMWAIARLDLPVNVTGYLGLVENLPSGSAYKPGDVFTARNGVSIEVLNTDAEGRVVLADVLSYAADAGAARIIDLATLTGACVVALGNDVTGLFANDQEWADSVLAAAGRCGELAWQMPMFELYADLIKSDVADIKNIGGRWGGAITAAKFLERFVGKRPWVHLDIAGPSFVSNGKAHQDGGATGCMVRTLVQVSAEQV